MRCVFFVFFSLLISVCYSQKELKPTVYLDQNLNLISSVEYYEKAISAIYGGSEFDQDSILIKQLLRKYEFGNFDSITLKQVQNLITKELGFQDFKKNIILYYKDSILGYERYNQSWEARASLDEVTIVPKKEFLSRRSSFDKKQKKCQKLAKKRNTKPFYVYSEMIDFGYKTKYYNHQKISKLLKSIFFKYNDQGIVILKPNGQYFFFYNLSENQVKKMLEKDWTDYIADYDYAKSNPQLRVMKFIDDMKRRQRIERERHTREEVERIKRRPEAEITYPTRKRNIVITHRNSNCYTYPKF